MRKVLKFTGIVFGIIILILIIGVGILATTVTPNTLKPLIASQVYKMTGRELKIDGDLSWTLFPYLGVKVGHATLSNPPAFQQKIFAEISHATISVKLMPLFHSTIEANGVALDGLTLNLIKKADGTTNWQDLSQFSHSPQEHSSAPNNKPNKALALGLMIPSIDLQDAHVTWVDEKTKQIVDLSHVDLHATDISWNHAFPVTSQFHYVGKNPDINGQASLEGKVALNLLQKMLTLQNLTLNIKAQQGKQQLTLSANSDVTFDMNQQIIKLENIDASVANLKLKGRAKVTQLSTSPIIAGHATMPAFDLKQFLQTVGQNTNKLQAANNVTADVDFATQNAATAIGKITMHGTVNLGNVQAGNITLTDVSVATRLQNGMLVLTPISAKFYEGKLQGHAQVNLNEAVPQMTLQANLTNVQAQPLLHDLGAERDKLKVMGIGNVAVQVTTAGLDADTITRHLNGTAKFSFYDGKLDGVNIGFMIDTAYALLKGKATPPENEQATHFGNLSGTATIQNGVVTNKDFFMNSPRFDTTGQGTIDLVNQKIDYTLQAMPKVPGQDNNNPLSINHLAIPLRITGSMQNPSIVPDTGAIAKEVANAELKRQSDRIKDKIENEVKNKLTGQANDLVKNLLGN